MCEFRSGQKRGKKHQIFFKFRKNKAKNKLILDLEDKNGINIKDQLKMLNIESDFYQTLYTLTNPDKEQTQRYLNSMNMCKKKRRKKRI